MARHAIPLTKPASRGPGGLAGIRADLTDYGPPGVHLHPPLAVRDVRLPSGVIERGRSLAEMATLAATAISVKMLSFHIREGGSSTLGVAVSERLRGPAIIDSMSIVPLLTSGVGVPSGIQLWVSDDNGGGGSDQANSTIISGDKVWSYADQLDANPVADTPPRMTFDEVSTQVPDMTNIPLGIPVTKLNWYLKVGLYSPSATSSHVKVHVRVVEGVDLDGYEGF